MTSPSPLDVRQLDAIARAITADLLEPYTPPPRPFLLGTIENNGVRAGYVQAASVSPSTPEEVPAGIQRLLSALRQAIGQPDGVVLLHGVLERALDPVERLDEVRGATVLVVSATLRRFAMDGDDTGPPTDPSRYREYTMPELQAFIEACGFEALFGGVTREGRGVIIAQPVRR